MLCCDTCRRCLFFSSCILPAVTCCSGHRHRAVYIFLLSLAMSPNIVCYCRLETLRWRCSRLLIVDIFLIHLVISMAIGSVIRLQPTVQGQGQSQGEVQPLDVTGNSARRVTRHYRLWNDCSKHYIQVKDAKVNALGQANSPFAGLYAVVSPSSSGLLQLKSDTTGDTLCMSRRGTLVVRTRPAGPHNKYCLFKEYYHLTNHMVEFHSAANDNWRVGFGKNGKSLAANRWQHNARQRACYSFMKTPVKHVYHNFVSDTIPLVPV